MKIFGNFLGGLPACKRAPFRFLPPTRCAAMLCRQRTMPIPPVITLMRSLCRRRSPRFADGSLGQRTFDKGTLGLSAAGARHCMAAYRQPWASDRNEAGQRPRIAYAIRLFCLSPWAHWLSLAVMPLSLAPNRYGPTG